MTLVKEIINESLYKTKLRDPRWIEFAKEIRKEKGNFCECCRQGDRVTQVHHWFYDYNREPWDYKAQELAVLCVSCHQELHRQHNNFRKYVFCYLKPQSFRVLNGALDVAFQKYDPLVFAHALAEFVSNPGMVERFQRSWEGKAAK